MIPQRFKNIIAFLEPLSNIQLRSKENKETYFKAIDTLLNEENLFTDIFLLDEYVGNLKKYFVNVYDILLEENKLPYEELKEKGLLAKDYVKSGSILTISEDEYLEQGLGLKYTDLESNLEKISNGVYDYMNQKWFISKEEMSKFLLNMKDIVSFAYSDKISRNDFILKPMFSEKEEMGNIKLISRYLEHPEDFINDYLLVKELDRISEKVLGTVKLFLKTKLITGLRSIDKIPAKDFEEKLVKDMGAQVEYFKNLSFKYKVNIAGEMKQNINNNVKFNFGYKIGGLPCMFDGRIAQYFAKETLFADMRTKKTKEGLSHIVTTTKEELKHRGYFRKDMYNLFIKKLDTKNFPELATMDNYKNIYKEREVFKLKV